jgi:hypothetical protein
MNYNSTKGTILAVVAGVYLALAAILVIGNLGSGVDLWMFTSILKNLSLGVVLLVAAAAGAVSVLVIWMLIRGVKAIRRGRIESRLKQVENERKHPAESSDKPASPGDS